MPVPQPTSTTEGPGLIAIRDVREQLFAAAERVLLRDGSNALTSRAVTTEAGVAKGVLHRHFADFDAFLAELVQARIRLIDEQAAALMSSAEFVPRANSALTAVGCCRTWPHATPTDLCAPSACSSAYA